MGVLGLTKYIEEHRLYEVVDFQAVANDAKSRNVAEPVIAVDGSQCAWYLYGNLDSLHGGQYRELRESCENFVKRFRDLGVRLSFFFDGLPVQEKMPRWIKRREDKAKQISNFFDKLSTVRSTRDTDIDCSILPEGVVPCATVAFKQIGCEVRMSVADCDVEVAYFAASNRSCIGVLSNDTDFLIYRDIPCLFPFSGLEMGQEVKGWRFRSPAIASHLGIPVEDLPVLASLVGNDIVSRETLREPHIKLRKQYGPRPVVELVAELMKRSPRGDLARICQVVFGDKWREGLELVQKSVRGYRYTVGSKFVLQNLPKWESVLQHVEAKHAACEIPGYVYTVMKCHIMRCGEALERSPPTGRIGRAMRARMYTVLLWDSGPGPFKVTEYVLDESGRVCQETVEVQKRLPQGDYHPGLLEMWSGPEDRRWLVFTWMILPTKQLNALRDLSPQHSVVPAAALCYLYHEAKALTKDEVRTFVVVAVSVKTYSVRQLSSLEVEVPTERAIYLATLFVRTILHVLDAAAACGLSFPRPAECQLDAYFDGKLFHYIYSKSRDTTDPRHVITWDNSREATFSRLMNIIE